MPVLPDEGIEPEARPEEAVIMEPAEPWQRPATWSDDPANTASIGHGQQFLNDAIGGRPAWQSSQAERGQVKARIVAALSQATGISEARVNQFIKQWSYSSNDNDMRSLAIQEDAAAKFGVSLSKWQVDQIAALARERIAMERVWGGASTIEEDPQYFRLMSRQEQGRLLTAMYDITQQAISDSGMQANTTIRMYRGAILQKDVADTSGWREGHEATISTGAISSWSSSRLVAEQYASHVEVGEVGYMLESDVPISRILGSARTGFGCLNESEWVILGHDTDSIRIIKEFVAGG